MTHTFEDSQSPKAVVLPFLAGIATVLVLAVTGEFLYRITPVERVFEIPPPETGIDGAPMLGVFVFATVIGLAMALSVFSRKHREYVLIGEKGISITSYRRSTHDTWEDIAKVYSHTFLLWTRIVLVRKDKARLALSGYEDMAKVEHAIQAHLGSTIVADNDLPRWNLAIRRGAILLLFLSVPLWVFVMRAAYLIRSQSDYLWPFAEHPAFGPLFAVYALIYLLGIRWVMKRTGLFRQLNLTGFAFHFMRIFQIVLFFFVGADILFSTLSVVHTAYTVMAS